MLKQNVSEHSGLTKSVDGGWPKLFKFRPKGQSLLTIRLPDPSLRQSTTDESAIPRIICRPFVAHLG